LRGIETVNKEDEAVETRQPIELYNASVFVCVVGEIINKQYNKEMKAFIFDIETPTEFVEKPVLMTKKIIFKFALYKRLHRKLRKVIYNGNGASVFGKLQRIIIADEGGVQTERHFLYVIDAKDHDAGNIAVGAIGGLALIENPKE
jgi:hypothetical protein